MGTFVFWLAAIVQSYLFFLVALFVIAAGFAFLDTGASPFIAQLGDSASSERRLNFSQGFNSLGSIAGVMVGTMFMFSGVELRPDQINAMKTAATYRVYLQRETMRVIAPYLVLGVGDIGGAIFTPMIGLLFEATRSMAKAMLIPTVCYAFIAYFAFIGSRTRPSATVVN